MFAILITPENMPKIIKRIPELELALSGIYYKEKWYAITGYVAPQGPVYDWTVLPAYTLEDRFEYDPEKIKTDWDQIVRK